MIDRDALTVILMDYAVLPQDDAEFVADQILASDVAPTRTTLTPEETELVVEALRAHAGVVGLIKHPSADTMRALANRLEASA